MPHCPFCDRDHSSRRGEHVIPKWIAKEFPDIKWDLTNRLTQYNRKGEKYIHILTPRPCSSCNTTWMSDLEKLAKPILLPLIHGIPTTLSIKDQIIIATWFVKTAMTYDLHSESQAPRPRYFEDTEHREFKSNLSFHPSYRVFIGKYTGDAMFTIQEDHSGVSVAHRSDLKPLGDTVRVYALTLLVKHLVLQIFCAKIPNDLTFYIRDYRRFYIELVQPHAVRWPPSQYFDDLLLDKFIDRWSEEPPPPPPCFYIYHRADLPMVRQLY